MYMQARQPIIVIDHERAGGAVVESQVVIEDLADAGNVGVDLLVGQKLARFVAPRRVSHLGGPAPHQYDGAMPRLLQAAQHHDLHQTPHMQAVRRRVEPDVSRHDARGGAPVERCGVGLLMDVPALGEGAQEFGFHFGHVQTARWRF